MPVKSSELRGEFEERLREALKVYGANYERKALVEEFMDKGLSRATIFRWIASATKTVDDAKADEIRAKRLEAQRARQEGRAAATVDRKAAKEAAAKGEPAPPPTKKPPKPRDRSNRRKPKEETLPPITAGIAMAIPRVPTIEDVRTKGLLPVVDMLGKTIKVCEDILRHGRAPDGSIRNSRLLMQAAEALRRAVETAAKLNETVAIQEEMQLFHAAVMQEIQKEAPAVMDRILTRIRRVTEAVIADGF